MTTVQSLLAEGAAELRQTSTTPRLDAELLLCHVTGLARIRFVAAPEAVVAPELAARYRELVARRRGYEPIAYIVGTKEFFGLEFEVSPAVLVPRPETELLVELALKSAPGGTVRFLDLGTGSGCISVALATELRTRGREVHGVAVDASPTALEVAARNVARHRLTGIVELRRSDWFSALGVSERFDLIVANPPYIAHGDGDVSPELRHEPADALYALDGGLRDLRIILESGPRYLDSAGVILCEFGTAQREELSALDATLEFFSDLAGRDRVLRLRR